MRSCSGRTLEGLLEAATKTCGLNFQHHDTSIYILYNYVHNDSIYKYVYNTVQKSEHQSQSFPGPPWQDVKCTVAFYELATKDTCVAVCLEQ